MDKSTSNALRFWYTAYAQYQKTRIMTGNQIISLIYRTLEPETWNAKKEKEGKLYNEYTLPKATKKFTDNLNLFDAVLVKEINHMFEFMESSLKNEKYCAKRIEYLIQDVDIYKRWLKHQPGIGPILAGGMLAYAGDISKFDTISKLWAYAGLHVVEGHAPMRKQGSTINWNPKLRTIAWKIGESFVKVKGVWHDKLTEYRNIELKNNKPFVLHVADRQKDCGHILAEDFKDISKGKKITEKNFEVLKGNNVQVIRGKKHLLARAKRKVGKELFSQYWIGYRTIAGLSVSAPYPEEYLGHRCSRPILVD